MTISIAKFVHSCLVVEKGSTRILFDPGKFSFNEGRVKPVDLGQLDWIVITHTHPDHLDIDVLRTLVAGHAPIVLGNDEVVEKLQQQGIDAQAVTDGKVIPAGEVELLPIAVRHQPVLEEKIPEVTAFLIDRRILHVADSFDERLTKWRGLDALILPIMAPFLTETQVYDFAKTLAPKAVVPVHDGYARDFFVETRHETYAEWFHKAGIAFHSLKQPGDAVEL